MSHERTTHRSPQKVTISEEFTGQHPVVDAVDRSKVLSFPDLKARNERRGRLARRAVIGAVGLIAAAGVVATVRDAYTTPGSPQEKQAFEDLKAGTARTSARIYVLHSGTQVRSTPLTPSDSKGELPGNEAFKVESGKGLIVEETVVDGDWIGFQKSEDNFDADKASANTYWVNVGELDGQVAGNGKPYVESFSAGGEAHAATMHDDGRFYEAGTDHRVAVSETVSAQNIQARLAELGVN